MLSLPVGFLQRQMRGEDESIRSERDGLPTEKVSFFTLSWLARNYDHPRCVNHKVPGGLSSRNWQMVVFSVSGVNTGMKKQDTLYKRGLGINHLCLFM